MVVYNPRFRFRPSLDTGQRILLEVEIAFNDWLKKARDSLDITEEELSNYKSISIPRELKAELLHLGNKLSPSELKAVKNKFYRLADDFVIKRKYKEMIPKERRCCECSDAKFVVKGREEFVLEYLCQSMKRILIHTWQRSNPHSPDLWVPENERTNIKDSSPSMDIKAFTNQCWSSSASSTSLCSFPESTQVDLPQNKCHFSSNSPSQSSSRSSLNPDSCSSFSTLSKSEFDDPKYSSLHSDLALSSLDAEDGSYVATKEYSSKSANEESLGHLKARNDEDQRAKNLSSGPKSSPHPATKPRKAISRSIKDGKHLINSYDALTSNLKRNVSTQTDETPKCRSYFRKSAAAKAKTSKPEDIISASLLGDIDSLPRRLGDVLRSSKYFQATNDTSKMQDGAKTDAKELPTDELLRALKKIEKQRSSDVEITFTNADGTNCLSEDSRLALASDEQLAMCASLSSSASSSPPSSGCSSPKAPRRRICGSGFSVFTISGHLKETSEYTGKYSFKSYSVAHC